MGHPSTKFIDLGSLMSYSERTFFSPIFLLYHAHLSQNNLSGFLLHLTLYFFVSLFKSQQKPAIILTSHLPWYRFSITLISWWNLSSCSWPKSSWIWPSKLNPRSTAFIEVFLRYLAILTTWKDQKENSILKLTLKNNLIVYLNVKLIGPSGRRQKSIIKKYWLSNNLEPVLQK